MNANGIVVYVVRALVFCWLTLICPRWGSTYGMMWEALDKMLERWHHYERLFTLREDKEPPRADD